MGLARKKAAELMLEVLKGKDPAAERRAGRQSTTFGTLAARYLEEHAKRRGNAGKVNQIAEHHGHMPARRRRAGYLARRPTWLSYPSPSASRPRRLDPDAVDDLQLAA